MIDLLLNSLMVEQDLEDALLTAVAYEMQDPEAVLKKVGMESSVPLMQLIRQLISNSTVRQLTLIKAVSWSVYELLVCIKGFFLTKIAPREGEI